MKIKDLPSQDRPIEKSIYGGSDSLSNSELIAVLLGSGTKGKSAIGVAEDILAYDAKGIAFLAESSVNELMKISGVGEAKAARIMAAVELGKRISTAPKSNSKQIETVSDVANLFMEDLRYRKKEYVKVLLLNVKGRILSIETISIGSLSNAPADPRDIFNPAIRKNAASLILVHNHPTGDPTPSEEDLKLTKRIYEASEIIGIQLLDHIIIGDGRFASFKNLGLL